MKARPVLERLLAKIEIGPMFDEEPCWLWTGGDNGAGYGKILRHLSPKRTDYTHRTAFEELVGPIPDGLTLDHLCRRPACCNPAHLEAVTQRENILRGDSVAARHAAKTHCPQGHPLTDGNLVKSKLRMGTRNCRLCKNAGMRRAKALARCAR